MTTAVANTIDTDRYVRFGPEDVLSLNLMVGGIKCAGCVNKIERALAEVPGLDEGRVNFSTHRLSLAWHDRTFDPTSALARVGELGFRLVPFDPAAMGQAEEREDKRLLTAMAVAGFAATNVMLLSVAVWAGLFSADMGPATRSLFHWISALIALPAIAYAGRPFFQSALVALKGRSLNMDVPISLAVLLAAAMSLSETITGGDHAYFDAAVTLLFFLLIGRYLDRRARSKARVQAEHLLGLQATAAMVIDGDGRLTALPVDEIRPGMRVQVAAGERVPVDGTIAQGRSDVDASLVTGESTPEAVAPGGRLFAGSMNLTGALILEVTAAGEDTLLAEIVRLMEAATQARGRFVRLADQAARIYAPAVHVLGLATFLGWWLIGGLAWQPALMTGIAVLIITCPCALGLAVPAVQIVAIGRLLKTGIIVKQADALERLAAVDTIIFDKTGTLTLGEPELRNADEISADDLRLAASIAATSRHPLAGALARAMPDLTPLEDVNEHPGLGLEANIDGTKVRLGSRVWCDLSDAASEQAEGPEMWLASPGNGPVRFLFRDSLRDDAGETVARLKRSGYRLLLVSGDRENAVARAAEDVGIDEVHALTRPDGKVRLVQSLTGEGAKVLMVGDGINDAPALAAAHVSLSPAGAAEIAQAAADTLFQGAHLGPVETLLSTAQKARRVALQNFGLALAYNVVAVPLAIAGFVTPLLAALAMSASSVLVISNALRLRRG